MASYPDITRSAELTSFLTTLHKAIEVRASVESESRRTIDKVMQALEQQRPSVSMEPVWLPACEHLDTAMENIAMYASRDDQPEPVSASAETLVAHAQAMLAVVLKIAWWNRTVGVEHGSPFCTCECECHAHG